MQIVEIQYNKEVKTHRMTEAIIKLLKPLAFLTLIIAIWNNFGDIVVDNWDNIIDRALADIHGDYGVIFISMLVIGIIWFIVGIYTMFSLILSSTQEILSITRDTPIIIFDTDGIKVDNYAGKRSKCRNKILYSDLEYTQIKESDIIIRYKGGQIEINIDHIDPEGIQKILEFKAHQITGRWQSGESTTR